MHFETLKVGAIQTNCYLLSGDGRDAVVIDPGGDVERIVARLEAKKLTPVLLVNTHGHADHITANAELRKRFPEMKIAIGREDGGCMTNAMKNLSFFINAQVKGPKADRLLDDGDVVEAAGVKMRTLSTPGHTPGGICLFLDDMNGKPALFSGDTLFAGSVGRCDIPGGDWDTIVASIRDKILPLPDATVVYPGHGPSTTVGRERKHNPYIGEDAKEE